VGRKNGGSWSKDAFDLKISHCLQVSHTVRLWLDEERERFRTFSTLDIVNRQPTFLGTVLNSGYVERISATTREMADWTTEGEEDAEFCCGDGTASEPAREPLTNRRISRMNGCIMRSTGQVGGTCNGSRRWSDWRTEARLATERSWESKEVVVPAGLAGRFEFGEHQAARIEESRDSLVGLGGDQLVLRHVETPRCG
jgi:hypothetical protein